ncbi:MAG: hypothetical protein AAFO95_14065 [Cyanobacteria bacterium J06600_6]
MLYHSRKLKDERWGIFFDDQLIATIGCYDTAQKIIYFLENRLSESPKPFIVENNSVNQYFHSLRLRA